MNADGKQEGTEQLGGGVMKWRASHSGPPRLLIPSHPRGSLFPICVHLRSSAVQSASIHCAENISSCAICF